MERVNYSFVESWDGSSKVGPIPEGVDPVEFVKSQGNGKYFCIHLFPKIRSLRNGLFDRVQGTYWIMD